MMLVYVNGKGWGGLVAFGAPKTDGTVLAQSAESPARVKSVGFELLGLVHGMR
jgi:hypothetical protein